jgi:hypothetical protein
LLVLAAAGCVDGTATLRVARDGSGTLDLRAVAAADATARIRTAGFLLDTMGVGGSELLKAFAPSDAATLVDRRALEQFARELGPGVRLVSVDRISGKNRTGFSARFDFPDIRGVRWRIPAVDGKSGSGGGLGFDFVAGDSALLKAIPAEPSPRAPPVQTAAKLPSSALLDTAMAALFEGFRLSAVLRVEGDIVRSNAAHREGSDVTLLSLSAASMKGPDLWALLGMRSMKDALAMHRRAPPGVKMQDPSQPLVIVYR